MLCRDLIRASVSLNHQKEEHVYRSEIWRKGSALLDLMRVKGLYIDSSLGEKRLSDLNVTGSDNLAEARGACIRRHRDTS